MPGPAWIFFVVVLFLFFGCVFVFFFFPSFSLKYLCMGVSVWDHSEVSFFVVQMFPFITEKTS